jgi:hypothetical protein
MMISNLVFHDLLIPMPSVGHPNPTLIAEMSTTHIQDA